MMRLYFLISIIFTLNLFSYNSKDIANIRYLYNKIEDKTKSGKCTSLSRGRYLEGGIAFESVIIYLSNRHNKNSISKLECYTETDDRQISAEYYYRKNGQIFFSFLKHTFKGMPDYTTEVRNYYDKRGKLIKRLIKGDSIRLIKAVYPFKINDPKRAYKNYCNFN